MLRFHFLLLLCCTVLIFNIFVLDEVNAAPCGLFDFVFKKHPTLEIDKKHVKKEKRPGVDLFQKTLALIFGVM
ncbi:hypothetical protein evm_013108 [Chilo suppressalis]|nr:hypothetical protein evm_013108 [Chilo suppressalis]